MAERRVPTLADAQRQVWLRGFIGGLLLVLSMIVQVLSLVKYMYVTAPGSLVLSRLGQNLHGFIDPLLRDWRILDLLWRAIPPWQPWPPFSTTIPWEDFYVLLGTFGVAVVGGLLLRSARARWALIMKFRAEKTAEAWRNRVAREVTPGDRGVTTVIAPGVWHQYMARLELWSHTLWGHLVIGLIIALISSLISTVVGGLIVLYAKYSYFQVHWSPSHN